MTAFARQLSAAQRQYDNAHDLEREADEARQEAVDERADELYEQYAADESKVLEAVEGVMTGAGLLDRAVTDFLLDWRRAGDDDATAIRDLSQRFHDLIWPHVAAQLLADAGMDAEHEQARFEGEQQEMRDFYRRGAA